MAEQIFRRNDIVTVLNYSTSPGRIAHYIGKVKKIKLPDRTEHNEYTVITGHGDRNTKCKIVVKTLYKLGHNQFWFDTSLPEEINGDVIYEEDPHSIHIITLDDFNELTEKFNNKINLLSRLFNVSFSMGQVVKKPRPFKRTK